MRFYVSKKDVKEGVMGDCRLCPAALAIMRKTRAESVSVQPVVVRLWGPGYNRFGSPAMYFASGKLQCAIARFDSGQSFPAGHYYMKKVK